MSRSSKSSILAPVAPTRGDRSAAHLGSSIPIVRRGVVALLCATFLLAGVALAQRGGGRGGDELQGRGAPVDRSRLAAEPRLGVVPDLEGHRVLIARDAHISFTARTAGSARAVLDAPDATEEQRAIAIVALGASGSVAERARLERIARTGRDLERRAAILALGEMSAGADVELEAWMAKEELPLAECALLALLRTDRGFARRRVEEMAADPTQRLAQAAGELLVFVVDPQASRPSRASALLMRLRYEAARLHGLIDGEDWAGATIRRLAQDPEWVREVILSAAPTLRLPSVRDHVLAELLRPFGRGRLTAAVAILPRELSDLVENELWRPLNDEEWNGLLEEIDARRLERLTLPILRAAYEVPAVRYRAAAMASLAGDEDLAVLMGVDPSRLSVDERVWVCLAIGARSDAGWLERFATLRDDKVSRVRMSFLVAQFRQGSKKAADEIQKILTDAESEDHMGLIRALTAAVHDPATAVLLEDRFLDADEAEKTIIATALCLEGRLVGRTQVRAALSTEPPPEGFLAVWLVRALRRNATAEDIAVLHRLFPTVEGDRQLDRELALALLDRSDAAVKPILRAGLWGKEFDVSMLAAGLMANSGGVRTLVEELRVPPTDASSGDLRRVGFAIGEWGGLDSVSALARELRWSSGHPALQGALLGALSTRTQ